MSLWGRFLSLWTLGLRTSIPYWLLARDNPWHLRLSSEIVYDASKRTSQGANRKMKRVRGRERMLTRYVIVFLTWSWKWHAITFAAYVHLKQMQVQSTLREENYSKAGKPGGMDHRLPLQKATTILTIKSFYKKRRVIGRATLWVWCNKTRQNYSGIESKHKEVTIRSENNQRCPSPD